MQRVVSPEQRPPHRRVIRPGEPGVARGVRVQIPEVLDARHLFPQPTEEVGLEFMVIGAAAMRVFRGAAGRGKVSHFKALVADGAEEGNGKFQPLELAGKAHDLGIDAVLQKQGLLHRSKSSKN